MAGAQLGCTLVEVVGHWEAAVAAAGHAWGLAKLGCAPLSSMWLLQVAPPMLATLSPGAWAVITQMAMAVMVM